jgi:uncharacterized protein (TIGR04255 family)
VLGVSSTRWSDLLNPNIASELVDSELEDRIKTIKKDIVFDLPDFAQARMMQAYGRSRGESVYVIDTDFFTNQKTEAIDVWRRLETFNRYARWSFRRCISEQLHHAMGPRAV